MNTATHEFDTAHRRFVIHPNIIGGYAVEVWTRLYGMWTHAGQGVNHTPTLEAAWAFCAGYATEDLRRRMAR